MDTKNVSLIFTWKPFFLHNIILFLFQTIPYSPSIYFGDVHSFIKIAQNSALCRPKSTPVVIGQHEVEFECDNVTGSGKLAYLWAKRYLSEEEPLLLYEVKFYDGKSD